MQDRCCTRISAKQNELKILWTQIAGEFKDYDYHLIFEGMNEPRNYGGSDEWNDGSEETRQNINTLNKVFIDTVRATGGSFQSTPSKSMTPTPYQQTFSLMPLITTTALRTSGTPKARPALFLKHQAAARPSASTATAAKLSSSRSTAPPPRSESSNISLKTPTPLSAQNTSSSQL